MDWPPPKAERPKGFTPGSHGWVKWYKGKTRTVCPKDTPTSEIVDRWADVKHRIDNEQAGGKLNIRGVRSYRVVLSEFLAACETRVNATNNRVRPMSRRTLHNYDVLLNDFGKFVGGGTSIDLCNRPEVFADYAKRFAHYSAAGFDSVVSRIGALFNWAEDMEYIDRWRPGPQFKRPAKGAIRDERIDLSKTFSPDEFAKLYVAANKTERCLLGLGLFAGMNNSEVSHLARSCVDLDAGLVDFRRRKHGKARRVCPLPHFVVADLRAYNRPEPAHANDADLFFLTEYGNPYSSTRKRDGKPSDSLSRIFRELMIAAKVKHKRGRNFSGLRTTHYNTARQMPAAGDFDIERKIIYGRAHGTIDLDSYLEIQGVERLWVVTNHIVSVFSTALADATRQTADES